MASCSVSYCPTFFPNITFFTSCPKQFIPFWGSSSFISWHVSSWSIQVQCHAATEGPRWSWGACKPSRSVPAQWTGHRLVCPQTELRLDAVLPLAWCLVWGTCHQAAARPHWCRGPWQGTWRGVRDEARTGGDWWLLLKVVFGWY